MQSLDARWSLRSLVSFTRSSPSAHLPTSSLIGARVHISSERWREGVLTSPTLIGSALLMRLARSSALRRRRRHRAAFRIQWPDCSVGPVDHDVGDSVHAIRSVRLYLSQQRPNGCRCIRQYRRQGDDAGRDRYVLRLGGGLTEVILMQASGASRFCWSEQLPLCGWKLRSQRPK